jgi:GNAT superfamily N-acetyltransferase
VSEANGVLDRLKPLAARVLRDYEIYWIFKWARDSIVPSPRTGLAGCELSETDATAIEAMPSALLREQAWYAGRGARAFLATVRGEPAGLCFYWFGERYRMRNFWPLRANEAKLVQVIVDPPHRGRGVGCALISSTAMLLANSGFDALYARIWHSNGPSIGAFGRAGWRRIALVLAAQPLGMHRRVRTVLPWHGG